MKLSELTPDKALAALLDSKVEVRDDATQSHTIRAYAQAEQPQTGLAQEFITVFNNGVISSWTKPLGVYSGNLALTICCELHNGTAKINRTAAMIEQCFKLVNGKSSQGFFFTFDPTNIITPTTVNLTTGYATTVLNVLWRTN